MVEQALKARLAENSLHEVAATIPLRIYHGDADEIIPVEPTREAVQNLIESTGSTILRLLRCREARILARRWSSAAHHSPGLRFSKWGGGSEYKAKPIPGPDTPRITRLSQFPGRTDSANAIPINSARIAGWRPHGFTVYSMVGTLN